MMEFEFAPIDLDLEIMKKGLIDVKVLPAKRPSSSVVLIGAVVLVGCWLYYENVLRPGLKADENSNSQKILY